MKQLFWFSPTSYFHFKFSSIKSLLHIFLLFQVGSSSWEKRYFLWIPLNLLPIFVICSLFQDIKTNSRKISLCCRIALQIWRTPNTLPVIHTSILPFQNISMDWMIMDLAIFKIVFPEEHSSFPWLWTWLAQSSLSSNVSHVSQNSFSHFVPLFLFNN